MNNHLLNRSFEELEAELADIVKHRYRVAQICDWAFGKRVYHFREMLNIPEDVRRLLDQRYSLRQIQVAKKEKSALDRTVKFTFKTSKVEPFSAVFLPHQSYNTLCISSQVGCAWKCSFCASGLVPFQRNLTPGEILDQVFWAEAQTNEKISNILFMGMGEPLANYDSVVRALRWMTSPRGLKMHPGRVTLSTTGLAPQIKKLADEKLNINLALSLHAPDDGLRREIMPMSSKFEIKDVLAACKYYLTQNKADLTFEYILIRDVNDYPVQAEWLAKAIAAAKFPHKTKINLIPYNPVKDIPRYRAPRPERAQHFFDILKHKGFIVHTRKPQGQDIDAACGQLL